MSIISDSKVFEVHTFNLLGIDPGTDTIGFSIFKLTIDDLKIVSVTSWTEKVSRFLDEDSFEVQVHSAKYGRINIISEKVKLILDTFKPLVVACEAPFFNRLRPNAYGPLIETVFTIQKTLSFWDHYKPLYMHDPPSVKKSVGSKKEKGEDNKEAVKRAIKLIAELKMVNFDLLDEHSIDATAVAYCHLLKLRNNYAIH